MDMITAPVCSSAVPATQKPMTAREAWIAGAIWALQDQGHEATVYVRDAVADRCPIGA